MTNRAADATIKGYYYQFDTSILKLLELTNNTDSITVEGIEDIDINTATETSTIQCKYLSKPKFINSAVRGPICLMLDHFLNPSTSYNLNYVLYAHFENEIPGDEPTIDLFKLKEILTYTENKVKKHYEIEKGISDPQLNAFLANFKLEFGKEFEIQQKEVIQKLKNKFSCTDFEADTLYYNNSLRIVIDRAIKKSESQRVITKLEFIEGIDCRKRLFNEWFIKLRTKKEYLKITAQALRATRALDPIRTKFIVIGNEILNANNSELPIEIFIENLISKYFKPNSALRNSKPLTLVLDCDTTILQVIKRNLISKEIIFNDGCEEIGFSSYVFNRDPIINTTRNGAKISKSSYSLKLITRNSLISNLATIRPPTVLFNFSRDDLPSDFIQGQHFGLKYCEDLKDIFKLLAP